MTAIETTTVISENKSTTQAHDELKKKLQPTSYFRWEHRQIQVKPSQGIPIGDTGIYLKMAEQQEAGKANWEAAAARTDRAVAVLKGEGVTGVINFEQRTPRTPLKITGTVQGLPPGTHGITINEFGDLSKGAKSTGQHFNPLKKEHGGPEDKIRHLGDLGNIEVGEDGTANINITDKQLALNGKNNILGRSLVIHELPDDLGKGKDRAKSKKTGNCGNGQTDRFTTTLEEMAVRPDPGLKAVALLEGEKVKGKLLFDQFRPEKALKITGEVTGLSQGEHGMHVHEFGDVTSGCSSAGAHYNPHSKNHGGIDSEERHVGDLGNIVANAQGIAKVNIEDKEMSLYGQHSILGRCLVVHADRDDLGANKMDEKSRTSGNSGSRVSCGVIGLAQPEGWG